MTLLSRLPGSLLPIVALIACCGAAHGDGSAWGVDTFAFASRSDGAAVLGTRDDYIAQLTPLDRAMRLETDQAVSEQEFLAFAAKAATDWSEAEKAELRADIATIAGKLNGLSIPLLPQVVLVKTTGAEEGNAAYTRGNAIMLPSKIVEGDAEDLRFILAHELFHVISRRYPALREQLYRAIGFVKVDHVAFPPDIAAHVASNPDVQSNDHFIRVTVDDEEVCAVPVLYFTADSYDTAKGGDFFRYLKTRVLVSRHLADAQNGVPRDFRIVGMNQLFGFTQQVGENTAYEIAPEEILADNFALLLSEKPKVTTPEILDRMRAVFAHAANPASTPLPDINPTCP